MRKKQGKRHSPEQIIRKLREADGMLAAGQTIGQVIQALEISEQTLYRWRDDFLAGGEAASWRAARRRFRPGRGRTIRGIGRSRS